MSGPKSENPLHPTLQRAESKGFDGLLLIAAFISIWGAVAWLIVGIGSKLVHL
jgi:hypothetical protein